MSTNTETSTRPRVGRITGWLRTLADRESADARRARLEQEAADELAATIGPSRPAE